MPISVQFIYTQHMHIYYTCTYRSWWKRDWDGQWNKDEEAEFDSEKNPPQVLVKYGTGVFTDNRQFCDPRSKILMEMATGRPGDRRQTTGDRRQATLSHCGHAFRVDTVTLLIPLLFLVHDMGLWPELLLRYVTLRVKLRYVTRYVCRRPAHYVWACTHQAATA